MKVLFIGDIVGRPGQEFTAQVLSSIMTEDKPDLVVANGENATHGRGLNQSAAEFLYDAGVEIITLGNHTWDQREILQFIDEDKRLVRPANYPPETPGQGFTVCNVNRKPVLIISVMGRAFLSDLDCPFRTVDAILRQHPDIQHVIVDVHAETTSEKIALGRYLDGRVSAVVGTHTHVQTADERILPKGTGYITDVGMTGPLDGVLGMDYALVLERMLTHRPVRFQVAEGRRQFNGVLFDICDNSGKTLGLRRIHEVEA